MIHTGPKAHVREHEVREQCVERLGREEIDDDVAMTIASWWQSPVGHGLVFHRVQSGQPFEASELTDAIATERSQTRMDATDSLYLDMLATWAINHE
jgi:hypothetical protein